MPELVPASADVAHERVDDEVIAINLATGAYFSLTGPAADCWTLLVAGTPTETVTRALAARYEADPAQVGADVAALAARLVQEGLLAHRQAGAGPAPDPDPGALPGEPSGPYRTPVLDKFDDMEELLLLDPIHDVDAAGWPLLPTEPG